MSKDRKSGSYWTEKMFFTKHDSDTGRHATADIDCDHFLGYFENLATKEEEILCVDLYKNNLKAGDPLPTTGGLWHEFIIVESTNWYWSFEKQHYGLHVQRSKSWTYVKNSLEGEDRPGSVDDQGRPEVYGHDGVTIYHLIKWIYSNDVVKHFGYHVTENCHHYASVLYDVIAQKDGRSL